MSEAYFNPATYAVIDKVTGEEVDIQLFIERVTKDKWERAYAKTLADYIGIGGNASCKVLAYLISFKDSKNVINGTQEELANNMGVSKKTVNTVFGILKEKDMLKEIRSGCYFLSPKVICYGNRVHGAMLLRIWGEID